MPKPKSEWKKIFEELGIQKLRDLHIEPDLIKLARRKYVRRCKSCNSFFVIYSTHRPRKGTLICKKCSRGNKGGNRYKRVSLKWSRRK